MELPHRGGRHDRTLRDPTEASATLPANPPIPQEGADATTAPVYSDMPWAIAWYADRPAIWLPRTDVDQRRIEQKIPGAPSKPTLEALMPFIEEAKQAWEGFVSYVAGHPKALDYRATGVERKKQLDARVDREKAYIPVKQRIADNAKERAEEAQKAAAAEAAKGGGK